MASHWDQRNFLSCSWHQIRWGEQRSLFPTHNISQSVKQHDSTWEFFLQQYYKILMQCLMFNAEPAKWASWQLIKLKTNARSFEVHTLVYLIKCTLLFSKTCIQLTPCPMRNIIYLNTRFLPTSFPWCKSEHLAIQCRNDKENVRLTLARTYSIFLQVVVLT